MSYHAQAPPYNAQGPRHYDTRCHVCKLQWQQQACLLGKSTEAKRLGRNQGVVCWFKEATLHIAGDWTEATGLAVRPRWGLQIIGSQGFEQGAGLDSKAANPFWLAGSVTLPIASLHFAHYNCTCT